MSNALLALLTTTAAPQYYAHPAVLDDHGVIAPWFSGAGGQADFRVRVAAETLKRYPWTEPGGAPVPAPHYLWSGAWQIAADGTITIPPLSDWANGDLGQRAAYVLLGWLDYYQYTGDAAALAHVALCADLLLDYSLTPDDHAWPRFLVSVPVKGKPYGTADPSGFIQLDIVAECGLGLLRAGQVMGNERWLAAARHWADLLAEKADLTPGRPPWGRYANPADAPWEDLQTGGVVFILEFFDELIASGYATEPLRAARQAGVDYLQALLDRWTVDDTWGRNYWDWPDPVQAENVTEFVARYLMRHPDEFPRWRTDARNLLSLFMHRTSVAPGSGGDVYAGAWAYPESSGCCGRSLWYGPLELAGTWAEYAVRCADPWAREIARRKLILATYDAHETGVVEDNIDGGAIVAGDWFKIAHPMALRHVLAAVAWLPETFAPPGENHLVRSPAPIADIDYGLGRIRYRRAYAVDGEDLLRLAFTPTSIRLDGRELPADHYTVTLVHGTNDVLVAIAHGSAGEVLIAGPDPAAEQPARAGEPLRFAGNSVRLIGDVGPDGGLAEVWLDGVRQRVGIDCWCPQPRSGQTLYWLNSLPAGEHTIEVRPLGRGNPRSAGSNVSVTGLIARAAGGPANPDAGAGPTGPQRMIFGYSGRDDLLDSAGHTWRPATEWIVRLGHLADSVAATWYQQRRLHQVAGTSDPELYRYGVHAREFTVHLTVGPGRYHARLMFCETRQIPPAQRAVDFLVGDVERFAGVDLAASAGGLGRAYSLVLTDLAPANGVISIRLRGSRGGEAILQALELLPGPGEPGRAPILLAPSPAGGNLLANPGFEAGVTGAVGRLGQRVASPGWQILFLSPSQCYVWAESAYLQHPDWGLPVIREGNQALRTHTDGDGHTAVYQEVDVEPGRGYRASVQVHAVDLHGRGFGATTGDSAGLIVHELDADGAVVAEHPKAAVTDAGDWREVSLRLVTSERTMRLRFILDTVIGGAYDQGHVTYDEAELAPAG